MTSADALRIIQDAVDFAASAIEPHEENELRAAWATVKADHLLIEKLRTLQPGASIGRNERGEWQIKSLRRAGLLIVKDIEGAIRHARTYCEGIIQ